MNEAYMTAAEKGMQKQLKNCKNNNLGAVKKLQQKRQRYFFHIFLFFLLTFGKIVCKYSLVPDGGVAQLVRAEES